MHAFLGRFDALEALGGGHHGTAGREGLHHLQMATTAERYRRREDRVRLSQLATTTRSLLPFGDLSVALLVFGIAVFVADIDWSPAAVIFLALAVGGGALIEAS